MKRRLAALVGPVLLLAVVMAPAASAATYPASDNVVTVEGGSTAITEGDEVAISAKTFQSGSDVTFTISSPASSLGTSRGGVALVPVAESGDCTSGSTCVRVADSDGVATALIAFTLAGQHTITAVGTDRNGQELTVTSNVTVAAADDEDGGTDGAGNESPDSGGLANTGAELIQYALIGLGLVALGAVVVFAMRRRSPGSPA